MPSSSARQPQSGSPIFTTLTRGFDAGTTGSTPEGRRPAGVATEDGSPLTADDCPIFDQLAGRRLARRRSNVVHPA